MQGNVKKYTIRTITVVALIAVAAILSFIIYSVVLRLLWRDFRYEVDESFAAAYSQSTRMEYGGDTVELDRAGLNFYRNFLFSTATTAYRKGEAEPTADAIILYLPDGTLTFTPKDGGEAIHVQWRSAEESEGYYLRCGMKYSHLETYFSNCLRNEPNDN